MKPAYREPSSRTYTEWAVHLEGALGAMGSEYLIEGSTEFAAQTQLEWWRRNRSDVEATLVSRVVTVERSGWAPRSPIRMVVADLPEGVAAMVVSPVDPGEVLPGETVAEAMVRLNRAVKITE